MISRWCPITSTFICFLGEFVPTLKDVAVMYQLPPTGSDDGNVLREAYTEEDARCVNFLRHAFKEAMKLKSRWVKGSREPLADFSPTRGDK